MLDFDEIGIWIVSSLFLGLIISAKITKGVLYIGNDFFWMSAFVFIMLFIFIASQKLVAWWLDCKIKIKWMTFRQYWFDEHYKLRWSFPVWFILPVLLFLVTLSRINWLSIFDFDPEPKESRIRRRWYDLTEMDVAKIAIAGPVALMFFAIILRILTLNEFAVYPALLAFLTLIPVGQGLKVLMGSRSLWIFCTAISLFIFLLIPVASVLATIVITILFAAFILIGYYAMWER